MTFGDGAPKRKRAALRDLILVGALVVLGYAAAARLDLAERLHRLLLENESLEADELTIALLILAIGLGVFAVLRWRERRRVEGTRDAVQSRYRQLVERVPAVTYVWNSANRRGRDPADFISPQLETILGYTPQEWTDDPALWDRLVHDDDRDRVLQAWEHCMDGGGSFHVEYRIAAKDGREVWIRDEAAAVETGRGGSRVLQGVMFDVTERKQAEQRIRQAEERYRTLVEHLPAAVYLEQPDDLATPLYMSPQYEQITGYTADERVHDKEMWLRLLHPDDREQVIAESDRTNRTGDPFRLEYRMRHRDGHWVWVRDEASLVGGEDGEPQRWQGILLDITDQRRAEDNLRRRDAILGAVGSAAQRFLKEPSWELAAAAVLARFGEATAASRVYIYENMDVGMELAAARRYEWLAPEIEPSIPAPPEAPRPYLPEFERWLAVLGRGDPLHGTRETFPPLERPELEQDGVRSLAVVPVFVDDDWWGFLGFEDCVEERQWTQLELEALRAAADILGTAIGRQRAGLQLAQTERQFRTLVEQIPAVTYIDGVEVGAEPIYVSPQYETVFGYTPSERLASPGLWDRLLHPDDRERAIRESEDARASDEPYESEYRVIARDGRVVWLRDQATLIRDEDGGPLHWQGIVFDVSQEREREEQLLETEARYRTLVEQIPAVTYIDTAGRPPVSLYISPQIEELTGFSVDEWGADPEIGERRIHPEDSPAIIAESDRTDDNGEPFRVEYRFIRKDGREIWVHEESELIRGPDGEPLFWQGLMYDISENRQAQQQIREAEERFRTLVETVPAITYVDTVDDDLHTLYVSPQVETMLGFTQDQWLTDNELFLRQMHPDDRERILAELHEHNTQGTFYDVEYRLRDARDTWRWIRDQAAVVRDAEGRPVASQGVMFDITEQRETQEGLREAEERFRALVETIPATLYIELPDPSSSSLYISPQLLDLVGVTPEDYQADPDLWERMLHPEDRERAAGVYVHALEAKEPWSIEYRLIRPDGREVWINDRSSLLFDDDGEIRLTLGFMFDVTEQKLYEQTLVDREQREREAADRLRALDDMKNTFLAAVSHELRSPLTSILGLSLTLERQDKLSDDDREDLLARLAANARKLDRLLKDLLDIDRLSRGIVEPQYRATDVGLLVRRTIESLDSLGGRTVIVQTEALVIPVDPAKVERIVENLVANAARHTGHSVTIWVRLEMQDGGALLTVEDDGPGVPDDLRETVFEPFQQGPTISKAQPGTGIGLSLVARFAELHGGRAWVGERAGGGASFHVFLPGTPPAYGGDPVEAEDAGPSATVTPLRPADAS
ncbi:MAG: PAS domain-containing protein [Actinomycetota bacterium]